MGRSKVGIADGWLVVYENLPTLSNNVLRIPKRSGNLNADTMLLANPVG